MYRIPLLIVSILGFTCFYSARLQAQVATSSPGQTSTFGYYDPLQPQPKAPSQPSTPSSSQGNVPVVPMDQYLAQKAAIARFSQSSFAFPPAVETSSSGPPARAPGAAYPPIAQAPTLTWKGIFPDYASGEIPPESPDIAVGPNDVLIVGNSNYIAQFTKSGTLKTLTRFSDFFASGFPQTCIDNNCNLYSDPCIRYDQLHGRFLFLDTVRNTSGRISFLLLAVSNGATYDSGWKIWALDAGADGSTGTGFAGDFWRLGFDDAAVYLSGNLYSANLTVFQHAKIRVVKKSDLYNPATTTLTWKDVYNLKNPDGTTSFLTNEDGSPADSISPVQQRGTPTAVNASLLVNATAFPQNLPASYLTVWKIADPLASTLTVTRTTVKGLWPYSYPAAAPQLGSFNTLNSGDSRMLKAIYRNGFLYTARDTGYTDQATTVTFDVVNTSNMTLTSQARLVNANSFYPSFDVPASTPSGVPFATANVITGTTTASDGTLTYPGISKLRAGDGPYNNGPSPAAWGDYFGGAVDPITGGLWASGAYGSTLAPIGSTYGTWAGYFPWVTASAFTDVPSTSVYSDYINVLSLWQITTGCSTTPAMFCPTQQITRAQLATFVIRAMYGNNFTYTTTPYFTDVPSTNVFFPFIQKMRDLGITHGCGATAFCPNDSVSRGDAAVFLVRGKLESLFGDSFTYPTTAFFTDVPSTDVRFPFVQKMSELGITSGCSATQFCPASLLTRQEVAVFLTRAFLD